VVKALIVILVCFLQSSIAAGFFARLGGRLNSNSGIVGQTKGNAA
jgi:hypothetical protein